MKERKDRPVRGGEVVEEDEHLKLGQLTAWTGMHPIPEWQVRVRFWWHLQPHKKIYIYIYRLRLNFKTYFIYLNSILKIGPIN